MAEWSVSRTWDQVTVSSSPCQKTRFLPVEINIKFNIFQSFRRAELSKLNKMPTSKLAAILTAVLHSALFLFLDLAL